MQREDSALFHMYMKGIILLGFTMLLFKLLVTGTIQHFMAPRMIPFVYITLFLCLLFGIIQIWRSWMKHTKHACSCGEEHDIPATAAGSILYYSLFIIPIITGFLFADSVIDGSVAGKRGVNLGGRTMNEQGIVDPDENMNLLPQEPPEDYYKKLENQLHRKKKIVVDDEHYISIMDIIGKDVEGFKGKTITFMGFVHREPPMGKNQLVIARFGITCCVADASVYGMLATGDKIISLKDDTWVIVTGVLDEAVYMDTLFPIVKVTKAERIQEPKIPYVYQSFQN
ncbi:TIGR03943 family protein [Bacillus sp. 165]|uniref:TIGR03943 family putative permease subunit n=1 Tax=Bacillus sp. 165 TaxID=1529117 RepID=UPI001ADC83B3|nr:TIGR03943 family protein [Bacillus sp. 165]MBO9128158.1 TIGR03943 family protein [Bacillus sp. 165]